MESSSPALLWWPSLWSLAHMSSGTFGGLGGWKESTSHLRPSRTIPRVSPWTRCPMLSPSGWYEGCKHRSFNSSRSSGRLFWLSSSIVVIRLGWVETWILYTEILLRRRTYLIHSWQWRLWTIYNIRTKTERLRRWQRPWLEWSNTN